VLQRRPQSPSCDRGAFSSISFGMLTNPRTRASEMTWL
jgi:hypothetical protein